MFLSNRPLKLALSILVDLLCVFVAVYLSAIVTSGTFEVFHTNHLIIFIVNAVLTVVAFGVLGLYNCAFRYIGLREAVKTAIVCAGIWLANFTASCITVNVGMSWSFVYGLVYTILAYLPRYSYRVFYQLKHRLHQSSERVLIVGAGEAGMAIALEMMQSTKLNMMPVGFADDDLVKIGTSFGGVKVLGNIESIPEIVSKHKVGQIFVAIPSASRRRIKEILSVCQQTTCKVRILPSLYQVISGEVLLSKMREVDVQDLLGREQITVNLDEIAGYVSDKVVLVTGGGGSIGSELCRQIAKYQPKRLIIFDIYENNAYDIQQELVRHYPDLDLIALIGSVRDKGKIEWLFDTYKPEIVFHAAAHKHVPLMETSPNEAVKNNVMGTYNVATCADKHGAKRFVLISTDKAVNPTNIMGATKRICEMIVQAMARHSKTEFVAVRFGNVLGSNGSVIPLFRKQISEGGPVTVTDENIIRYFMTIPEAVSLVLQAGAYAKGGEIFVLDMGEPMRIYDLAYNLIKLSGYKPNEDIEIKITGLRPGEKLYEERLMAEEGMQSTPNQLISIGKPLDFDEDNLHKMIDRLYVEAYNETDSIKKLVSELVTTYKIDTIHQ